MKRLLIQNLPWLVIFSLLCAARKPAIRPGHDFEHPALTPIGKPLCKAGLLKLFGSYGWNNCKNEKK
jgi:hypothetical protein